MKKYLTAQNIAKAYVVGVICFQHAGIIRLSQELEDMDVKNRLMRAILDEYVERAPEQISADVYSAVEFEAITLDMKLHRPTRKVEDQ